MLTLYNVISADEFIADENGKEDFIPDDSWDDVLSIYQKYDAVIFGSNSYKTLQTYDQTAIESLENLKVKRVVVSRDPEFRVKDGYVLVHSLQEAVALGKNILLSSGPTLNDVALQANLVDRIMCTIIPEKIGKGMRTYSIEPNKEKISEEIFHNGRKLVEYRIIK